jgi:hypothetical protein
MLTLGLPGVELSFQVAGLDSAHMLSAFLREMYGRKVCAEVSIGVLDGLAVRIVKDDEHADRFFVRAAGEGMIDLTVVDPVAGDLVRAAGDLATAAADADAGGTPAPQEARPGGAGG